MHEPLSSAEECLETLRARKSVQDILKSCKQSSGAATANGFGLMLPDTRFSASVGDTLNFGYGAWMIPSLLQAAVRCELIMGS